LQLSENGNFPTRLDRVQLELVTLIDAHEEHVVSMGGCVITLASFLHSTVV